MRQSRYHMEEEEVLPYRNRVSLLGCMSAGVMLSCFSISSTTPRPPVWMHTWSNASLKSGMYGRTRRFSTCAGVKEAKLSMSPGAPNMRP